MDITACVKQFLRKSDSTGSDLDGSSSPKPKKSKTPPSEELHPLEPEADSPLGPTISLDSEVEAFQLSCPVMRYWTVDQVCEWLGSIGFQDFIPAFKKEEIDGEALLNLNNEDMSSLGLKVGHRSKLRQKIAAKATRPDGKNSKPEKRSSCVLSQICSQLEKMQKQLDRYCPERRELSLSCSSKERLTDKSIPPAPPRETTTKKCAMLCCDYFESGALFASLPGCIHRVIFTLLSSETRLRRAALVCKYWRCVTLDRKFWDTLDLTKCSSASALQHVFRSFQPVGAAVKYLKLPSFEKGYAKNYSACDIRKSFPNLVSLSIKDRIIKPQFIGQISQAYPNLALELWEDSGDRWYARQDDRVLPETISCVQKVRNIQIEDFILEAFLCKLKGLRELGLVLKFDMETAVWLKTCCLLKTKADCIWPNLEKLSLCSHNLRKVNFQGNLTIAHSKLKTLSIELFSQIGLILKCPQLQNLFYTQGNLATLATEQFSNLSYVHLHLSSVTDKLCFDGRIEYLDVFAPNATVQVNCPNLKRSRLIANDVMPATNQGEYAVMCRLAASPLTWELPENLIKVAVKGTFLTRENVAGLKNVTVLHCVVSNTTDFSMFSLLPQLKELILHPTEKINLMELAHPTLESFGFGQMQYDGSNFAVAKTKFDFQNLKHILLEGAVPFKFTESLRSIKKLNLVSCWRFTAAIPSFTNLTHLHLSVKRLDFLDIVSQSLQFLFVAKSNAITDLRVDCPNLRYLSVHRLSKAKSIQILHVNKLEGISIQYCKKLSPQFAEIFPNKKDFGPLKFFVSQYSSLDFDFLTQVLPLLPEKVHLLQLEGSPISLEIQDYLIQKYSYQLSRFEVLDKDILPDDSFFFPIHRWGAYDVRKDANLEDLISWDLIFNAVGSQKKFGDKFSDKYMIKAPNCQLKHHNCWCKLREDELI